MTTLEQELRRRAGLDVAYDPTSGEQVPPERAPERPDAPHPSGEDRYAIYSVWGKGDGAHGARKRIAETCEAGIGLTIRTLREEEQITNDTRVGILDRETRTWIVNPWAKGNPE